MGNLSTAEPFCSRAATPFACPAQLDLGWPSGRPFFVGSPANHRPAMDDLLLTFGYAALFAGFIVTMAGEDHLDP